MHNPLYENEYTTAFSIELDKVVQLFNIVSPLLSGREIATTVIPAI